MGTVWAQFGKTIDKSLSLLFWSVPKLCPKLKTSTRRDRKKPQNADVFGACFGGATRNRTGDKGFADPCLTAWPWRRTLYEKAAESAAFCLWSGKRGSNPPPQPWQGCALPNELFPHKKWCLRVDLNHRHRDFQSLALPTELPRQIWRPEGGSNP